MKRSPLFDPPEYVSWTPASGGVEAFDATLDRHPARRALVEGLSRQKLLALYEGLLRNRLHDIALKRWVRQGVISKAWLGTGEEASTIGPVHALEANDVVAPMIRNAGACHERGMPLAELIRGYLGTQDGPTRGRDLHTGDWSRRILTPISHIAAVIPVTVGVAMALKLKGERNVALSWVGDGSTKNGDFHEGANLAAAQQAPLVLIIQNNQVALGTPVRVHSRGNFLAFADAYGMPGAAFDGNNVLDAWAATRLAAEHARAGAGPYLLLAETFRLGGHATHDEREAREVIDPELFAHWGQRDPIGQYEQWLLAHGHATAADLEQLEERIRAEVDRAADEALVSRSAHPVEPATVTEGVYAD